MTHDTVSSLPLRHRDKVVGTLRGLVRRRYMQSMVWDLASATARLRRRHPFHLDRFERHMLGQLPEQAEHMEAHTSATHRAK
jgi:hypothetical protein